MSVVGYLSAGKPVLRVAREDADESGIRFEKVADEQLVAPAGEYYESVEDYDPVLRAHCRL